MSHCSGSLCIIESSLPYNKSNYLRQLLLCYINQTELNFCYWALCSIGQLWLSSQRGIQCGQFPRAWYDNLFFYGLCLFVFSVC